MKHEFKDGVCKCGMREAAFRSAVTLDDVCFRRDLIRQEIFLAHRTIDDVFDYTVMGADEPRCPKCGYSDRDAFINGDHYLCDGIIPK